MSEVPLETTAHALSQNERFPQSRTALDRVHVNAVTIYPWVSLGNGTRKSKAK